MRTCVLPHTKKEKSKDYFGNKRNETLSFCLLFLLLFGIRKKSQERKIENNSLKRNFAFVTAFFFPLLSSFLLGIEEAN